MCKRRRQFLVMSIKSISEFLNLVPQEILVTAPKIARGGGWLGFQLLFIPQLGAMTILVMAPKIARGVPLPVYINVHVYSPVFYWAGPYRMYIYVYSGFVYFSLCCVFIWCTFSHGSGPWEGAFNQLGNKLTIDDLWTSSLLKVLGCQYTVHVTGLLGPMTKM